MKYPSMFCSMRCPIPRAVWSGGGVNRVASVFFLGVLSYATWDLTIHSYERATVATGARGFRLWPFEAIAATGASIAFLCLIARLFQRDTGEEET